jgi:probable rRNA maturation factor
VLDHFNAASAQVEIALLDDETISRVHADYLGDASVTDVISFDLSDETEKRCFQILVNESQAARQCVLRALTLESELALYITHGLLHQLGYDDHSARGATAMHRMEDQLLEQSGYGAVYYKKK